MGNSLEAHRSAIGMFYNCSRISSKCVLVQADSYRNILLFVLHFILMIGNVELNPDPETYISSSPPNLDNSSNDNSISLCNINIRSIRNKTNFVQHFAGAFDILVITESHLDNSIQNDDIELCSQTESNGRGASDLYERKCKHFKDNPTRE